MSGSRPHKASRRTFSKTALLADLLPAKEPGVAADSDSLGSCMHICMYLRMHRCLRGHRAGSETGQCFRRDRVNGATGLNQMVNTESCDAIVP